MRVLSLKCRVVLWTMACVPVCAQTAIPAPAASSQPVLTTAAAIRALSPTEARQSRPVHVRGVVTFYNPVQQLLFFQDETGPIYVDIRRRFPITAGSRVEIWGTTGREYSTQIEPTQILETSHGPLPKPSLINYEAASRRENDCRFVTLQGIIRSATRQNIDDSHLYLIELEVENRMVEVAVSSYPGFDPTKLLDVPVRIDGVLGGRLDLKDHILGLVLHVSDASDIAVIDPARQRAEGEAVTPLNDLLSSDHSLIENRRLHTRGILTLYDPGERLVIKRGDDSLLVQTRQEDPAVIGQLIEVTGFPTAVNGSPALANAQFWPIGGVSPLPSRSITFSDAMSGNFANELVAIEGEVVSETQEDHLDTLILQSGKHVFQAVFRKRRTDLDSIPVYLPGTQVRVTGVCTVRVRGFWGVVESFQIHLRSAQDIQVTAPASWWTVRHMLFVTTGLLGVAMIALTWGLWMRRRLSAHETILRQKIESEAARLATLARLEHQRGHILELINSFEPLPSVLNAIHLYAAEMWPEVFSYSHLLRDRKLLLVGRSNPLADDISRLQVIDPTHSNEACAGAVRSRSLISISTPRNIWTRPIISSQGAILGTITFESQTDDPVPLNSSAFDFGCNLAAIAIDNRRLYEDVLHRSQHDQLTGLPNRALLEARVEQTLSEAAKNCTLAAVLFLDLDDFKPINDNYSHRVGDLYLCEVAMRFEACLREIDTLARVGGDEFIVCVAGLTDAAQARQIADRLIDAMHAPFLIEGHAIKGTVSIGMALFPESGTTSSALKHEADAAMYAAKRVGGDQVSFRAVEVSSLQTSHGLTLAKQYQAG